MRAFVYAIHDGRDRLGSGRITPEYRTFGNMMRCFIRKLPPGQYRVYVYNDWFRRYKDADRVYECTVPVRGSISTYSTDHRETPSFRPVLQNNN